jgi:DnaJ family protein C protein 9
LIPQLRCFLRLTSRTDKASPGSKDEANRKFQQVAFAYAILSDERRRKRYDLTGNASETLDLEDDDFNWVDFYREQFSTVIDGKAIDKLKSEFKGSEEEKSDLLMAYERHKGDLDKIYEDVMLSNPLEDDDRFRSIINQAVRDGDAKNWPKFSNEPVKKRVQRLARAKKEAVEAANLAKELGLEEKLYGNGTGNGGKRKKKQQDGDDLMELIQQRQKARAANFLADLEARYAPKPKTAKGKKGQAKEDEPRVAAFQATADRKRRTQPRKEKGKQEDQAEVELNDRNRRHLSKKQRL